jgi:hypothetical protein
MSLTSAASPPRGLVLRRLTAHSTGMVRRLKLFPLHLAGSSLKQTLPWMPRDSAFSRAETGAQPASIDASSSIHLLTSDLNCNGAATVQAATPFPDRSKRFLVPIPGTSASPFSTEHLSRSSTHSAHSVRSLGRGKDWRKATGLCRFSNLRMKSVIAGGISVSVSER